MAKMDKKWVALCTAAIGAIYSAGYFATEAQATYQQPPQEIQASVPTAAQPLSQQPVQQQQQPQTAPTAIQSSAKQASSKYKDGTYTGTGRNRRGSIQVAVTVKRDKITDVEISDFAMHYSEDDVVGLPKEVLQLQSAQVKNVSGATYSTDAFKDAVQEALSKARTA